MAKKKLQSFSADDASDDFTPTVKTFVSAETPSSSGSPGPASKPQPVPKAEKPAESQPGNPQNGHQSQMEKIAPSASPAEETSKPVKGDDPPLEKTVKPAPPAQSKTALTANPSEIIASTKPDEKPESKPVVPKKPSSAHPAPAKQVPQKQPEVKEKTKTALQTHIELVGFILGKEEYAIEINKVQDINRMVEITRVPKAPDFVEGVMNLRGKVIPVIHLRKRFNMPEKPFDRSSRIIVVEVAECIMGFIVDAITEVLRVPSHIIEKTPDLVTGIDSEYIMGVGKMQNRLLILIDLGKVLTKKSS